MILNVPVFYTLIIPQLFLILHRKKLLKNSGSPVADFAHELINFEWVPDGAIPDHGCVWGGPGSASVVVFNDAFHVLHGAVFG